MCVDAYCTLGVDREYDLTESALLKAMDTAHVARAVIAPADRRISVHNRQGNDRILKAAAAHPDRFIPTCAVNPWYGDEAIAELHRAIGAGARMLVLHPTLQGFGFGDDLPNPLIKAATSLHIPIYVHTGTYHFGTPTQLALAAKRFSDATFIMGHCGSTDFKVDALEVARQFDNIFPEVSLARPFFAADAVKSLGDERVIMGSGAPLNDLVFEWDEMRKVLPPHDHPGFYGATLLSLLEGQAL